MIQNQSHKNTDCHAQVFVISACSFTFQGYQLLLKQQGTSASHIRFDGDTANREDVYNIIRNHEATISVFPGKAIVDLLESLKRLADILNTLPVIRQVTLYGDIPDSWLYGTLRSLLNNHHKLSQIRIATLTAIGDHHQNATGAHKERSRLLRNSHLDGSDKGHQKGLTQRELDVLLNFYRGMSVNQQCEKLGLTNKTVYTHRKEGLRKLQLIHLWLNDPKAYSSEGAVGRQTEREPLSSTEVDVFNALLKREIFPAYQIITDKYKKGVGFEILLRWNKNGKILKSAHFLAEVKNRELWLNITALVLHAAISGINKYNGKYYFSINIPPQLAAGNALPEMAKKAIKMLLNPQWAGNLVFEFAEDIDVTKDKTIPETMRRLRSTGCRLFLDDCFSSHQTMFPIRQVHFDGLKLDRDIVGQFVANDNDYNLIKAIQIYSDMTGSECIAEGVDSAEKFEKLVALGVKSFQGYYLSRAVKEEELDRMVRMFS
ncbi:EAL domain-containing protein [Enterobacter cloacae subsp. dissolvens]|uniref:EAL domain-containing protein n=1 Tax=Enterobacter cloacae TaxID=550 RepID=UPI00129E0BE3|nr:EAL domain-containing protein [Enterobacter cloacae]MRM10088.1 EAL domain-containing protein [Enterobacter cloacae subsp. dissolvens]